MPADVVLPPLESSSTSSVESACTEVMPTGIEGSWVPELSKSMRYLDGPDRRTMTTGSALQPRAQSRESRAGQPTVTTIGPDTITTTTAGLFSIELSYRVISGSTNRVVVEPYDEVGAGELLTITRQPCRLVMETSGSCKSAHCLRTQRKALEQIVSNLRKLGAPESELKKIAAVEPNTHRPAVIYYRPLAPLADSNTSKPN